MSNKWQWLCEGDRPQGRSQVFPLWEKYSQATWKRLTSYISMTAIWWSIHRWKTHPPLTFYENEVRVHIACLEKNRIFMMFTHPVKASPFVNQIRTYVLMLPSSNSLRPILICQLFRYCRKAAILAERARGKMRHLSCSPFHCKQSSAPIGPRFTRHIGCGDRVIFQSDTFIRRYSSSFLFFQSDPLYEFICQKSHEVIATWIIGYSHMFYLPEHRT